jgi:hypothetical protein
VPPSPAALTPEDPARPRPRQAPPERRPLPRLLHVTNGDSAADSLRAAGVEGELTLAADPLYEGPAPPALSPGRWRRMRARYLAEQGYDGYDECLARLTAWDHGIEGYRSFDEVVLWFEHDLFDQLQLIRLLARFATDLELDAALTRLSLVATAFYLGAAEPQSLSALLDLRQPVSPLQLRLGCDAWAAFCSPDPRAIERLLASDTSALPFLAGALRRHLEEFPAAGSGLPRTERQALAALAGGPLPLPALFGASQVCEERLFMGDLSFCQRLRELAAGPHPLLRLDPPTATPRAQRASLTAAGFAVLDSREDWLDHHTIDRWLGGVHLTGRHAAWRWNPATGKLVGS